MGIVAQNKITCSIEIKESNGEVYSANFNVGNDPTGLTDLSGLYRKNNNPKPFILGITPIGEDAYGFRNHEYMGISTIGSGTGAKLTLIFSEPVKQFTLFFDEKSPSIPDSMTIDGVTYPNDDFEFSYNVPEKKSVFEFTIGEMNVVNGVSMPLIIVGIENRIKLDVDDTNAIQQTRLSHTYTSEVGKPAYGIISQNAELKIFDTTNDIAEIIDMGALKSRGTIDFAMGVHTTNDIGKYYTNSWTENGNNNYSVKMDDILLKMQKVKIKKSFYSETYQDINTRKRRTALDLYQQLISVSGAEYKFADISKTKSYEIFSNIYLNNFAIEEDSLWNVWNNFCKMTQSYMFMQYDGTIRVISQYEIDDKILKNKTNENTTLLIPFTQVQDNPSVTRILENRFDKINYSMNVTKVEKKAIYTSETIKAYSSEATNRQTGYIGLNEGENNPIYNVSPVDVNRGLRRQYITYDFNIDEVSNFLFENIKNDNDIRKYVKIKIHENLKKNVLVNVETGEYNTEYDSLEYELENINIEELYLRDNILHLKFYINIFNPMTFSSSSNGYVFIKDESFTTDYTFDILAFVTEFLEEQKTLGAGENEFVIDRNIFVNEGTRLWDGNQYVAVADVNAQQILNNFTGKQTIKFKMSASNLFDINGNLVYNINNGQLIKLFDIFEIQDYSYQLTTDINFLPNKRYYKNNNEIYSILLPGVNYTVGDIIGENIYERVWNNIYGSKRWIVAKTELETGGANFINVEAVEI